MSQTEDRRVRGDHNILADIIESDPVLREMFSPPRDPRYRYWRTPDGRMFLYTTERFSDGKFGSAILVPVGPGARSGGRKVTGWRTTREVHHPKRKDARARAYRLYQSWKVDLGGRALRQEVEGRAIRAERFGSWDEGEMEVKG